MFSSLFGSCTLLVLRYFGVVWTRITYLHLKSGYIVARVV
jgi:hypothetical protein